MHADQFSQSMVSPFTGECLANGRDRAASRKERLGLNFATAEDFDAYVERGNRLWWATRENTYGTQGQQGQPVTRPVVPVNLSRDRGSQSKRQLGCDAVGYLACTERPMHDASSLRVPLPDNDRAPVARGLLDQFRGQVPARSQRYLQPEPGGKTRR